MELTLLWVIILDLVFYIDESIIMTNIIIYDKNNVRHIWTQNWWESKD